MDIKIFLDSGGRKLARLTPRFDSVDECLKYYAEAKQFDINTYTDEEVSNWSDTTAIRWYKAPYDRFGIDLKHF